MLTFLNIFLTDTASSGNATGSSWATYAPIIYLVIIGLVFYFVILRPQKKQQKQLNNHTSFREKECNHV